MSGTPNMRELRRLIGEALAEYVPGTSDLLEHEYVAKYLDEHGVTFTDALLTDTEAEVVHLLAQAWNGFCAITSHGARDADLAEIAAHIHALQHAVLAQVAARAFPNDYRLLGEIIPIATLR